MKRFLVAPGPTPVAESVRLAMARSAIHHRSPEFSDILKEVGEGLQWLFQTTQDVLVLTCSGTGAFEAGIANFTRRGQTVISIGGGKFSERWSEVARCYGLNVVCQDVEWGRCADVATLRDLLLEYPECTMVTVCASETSTGVFHPIKDIVSTVKEHSEALVAVDGITAVGVEPLPMDEWGIDILVSGSQKAFSLPPGLGFIAASARAWDRAEASDHPRYYFDLVRERAKQSKNTTAYTPAISLVIGLQAVLRMMRDEGLEALFARHDQNARAARAGLQALGLSLFAERPANSVTSAVFPESVSAPDVVKRMRDTYGVTVAGGQEMLKPRLIRVGHLGYYDRSDMLIAISALELALRDVGFSLQSGAGVAAVQAVFGAK
jgi:serine---pyruvate transaminase